MGRARLPCRYPASYALGLVYQHEDLATGNLTAIVQLQIFAEVLIAGGSAVPSKVVEGPKSWMRAVSVVMASLAYTLSE